MLADYGRFRFRRMISNTFTNPLSRGAAVVSQASPRRYHTRGFRRFGGDEDFGRFRFSRRFGDLGGLTQDFEAAKSKFEAANAKVSLFTKSPITTAKYKKLDDEKKAIMLGGGPEGGQIDDAVVKRWISESQGVVNDINSLYQTYIVNKQGTPLTGSVLSSPPTVGAPGQNQIFGMNKYLVYGLGGLVVAGLLTYIMPKKPAQLKMSEV